MYIRNGSIVENYHTNFTYILDSDEAINDFILNFYTDDKFKPKEIVTSYNVDEDLIKDKLNIAVTVPKKGDKVLLTKMADLNALKDFEDMKNIYKNQVLKKLDTIEELGNILN